MSFKRLRFDYRFIKLILTYTVRPRAENGMVYNKHLTTFYLSRFAHSVLLLFIQVGPRFVDYTGYNSNEKSRHRIKRVIQNRCQLKLF
jgi:hypothetical protein